MATSHAHKVQINICSHSELLALPNVGKKVAGQIEHFRELNYPITSSSIYDIPRLRVTQALLRCIDFTAHAPADSQAEGSVGQAEGEVDADQVFVSEMSSYIDAQQDRLFPGRGGKGRGSRYAGGTHRNSPRGIESSNGTLRAPRKPREGSCDSSEDNYANTGAGLGYSQRPPISRGQERGKDLNDHRYYGKPGDACRDRGIYAGDSSDEEYLGLPRKRYVGPPPGGQQWDFQ